MKKKQIITLVLLAAFALAMPAVSSSPSNTAYANLPAPTDPDKSGGTKGGSGGSILDSIISTISSIFGSGGGTLPDTSGGSGGTDSPQGTRGTSA